MYPLLQSLESRRVLICVGSGGVGKTSTSAALALHAARSGRRVLCLTIDPARRLANSLGLTHVRTDEQEVPAALFRAQGVECRGSLAVMMLNTRRTFEELVERHAPTPESRDRILGNRLFQYVAGSLSGTQEYMAMEKLHAVRRDPQWDLIVLDTPPTSNALDFLDAPDRLIEAIDSPAMRWFVHAFETSGSLSAGLVGRGAAFVLRGLGRFTGMEFLEEVAEFVTSLNALFGGFQRRAEEVAAALRSAEVSFVIVTAPTPLAIAEAVAFQGRLDAAGMASAALVVNGVHPRVLPPVEAHATLVGIAERAVPPGTDARRLVARLRRAFDDEAVRAEAEAQELQRLDRRSGPRVPRIEVPAFDEDIHDIRALARMADLLVGPDTNGAARSAAEPPPSRAKRA